MHRFVLLALVAATGCGAELDDPDGATVIAASCDDNQIASELSALPGVTAAREVPCTAVAPPARCFTIGIRQPLSATSRKTFEQQLYLVHRGCTRPMVVADWGYENSSFFDEELSILFQANTLWIEHRYQGQSVPAVADWDWSTLTIENGARDMHQVIESFKHMYGGHWVSTGASKGGITAAYHAYFFPLDVDGSVPYVAPASRQRIDPSYQSYLELVMTSSCAQRVRDAQVAALTTRKSAMISRLTDLVGAGGEEGYLEAMAGFLDWSFWQYSGLSSCPLVPDPASSDDRFFSFLRTTSGFPERLPATDERSDGALAYEWLTEQGFAQEIGNHVAPYITDPTAKITMEDQFRRTYPDVLLPAFDGSVTREVRTWVHASARNVVLIYGELDPWSGGALDAPTQRTSGRFFVPGANHGAQIAGLPADQRDAALLLVEGMFNEPANIAALPRAIEASARRDAILARAMQHERAVLQLR
jgi:hypothetical protein